MRIGMVGRIRPARRKAHIPRPPVRPSVASTRAGIRIFHASDLHLDGSDAGLHFNLRLMHRGSSGGFVLFRPLIPWYIVMGCTLLRTCRRAPGDGHEDISMAGHFADRRRRARGRPAPQCTADLRR